MIEKLIRQLESSDPKQRMKAIKALAKAGDSAALKPLLKVYKSDPDPKVRELALKAGRYIKSNAGSQSPSRTTRPAPTSYYDDEVSEDQYADDDGDTYDDDQYSYYDVDDAATNEDDTYDDGRYMWDGDTSHRTPLYADSITDTMMVPAVNLSGREKSQALSMLDEVENLKWRGQNDQAIEVLSKAMQLDPKLWKNGHAVHLVRTVTKLPPDEAYKLLMGDAAPQKTRRKKKPRRHPGDVTWGDAFVDLIIYGVVSAALVLLPGLLGLNFLKDSFADAGNAQSAGLTQQEYEDVAEFLDTMTPITVVIIAVAYGVTGALVLFVQDIGIHIAALIVFSGEGGLKELIRKTTLFYTFSYALIALMAFAMFWPGLVGDQGMLNLSVAILMASLIVFIWSLKLISDVYQFGMFKGCASVVVGYIIISVGFSCAFTQLLGRSFG